MTVRMRVMIWAGAALLALPVAATPNQAEELRRAGEIMPFDVIQRRVLQDAPGEYMGSQFDPGTRRYRFRFLRDGNVINVDIDARTGERVRQRQSF
jgi:uncharacterized membrane protein YkoI